jgi:hypothetical protein
MNERLKELAVQAGLSREFSVSGLWLADDEELERFADLVRADEREAINLDHRIALAAGAKKGKKGYWEFDEHELKVFIGLIRESEREACARLCESNMVNEYASGKVDHNEQSWTEFCAVAIRAKG